MKDSDAIFVTCTVSKGTGLFMLKVSKNYAQIATDLGFTVVANPATANARLIKVSDALKSGDVIKLRISLKGTASKPATGTNIICSTKEVAGAMSKIPQKLYGERVITGVKSPQKLRYR
ncbi:hypothetical protein [Microcoleus sp.]|uniref:hypothetical protein n=1 Tax=Microcoleus sp. TaxID=44472 RepID=UPI0035269A97